jgi:iron-sulfur cluster assembly protein
MTDTPMNSNPNPATLARPKRVRPKALTLTDAAAARVQEIIARADKPILGIRVGVKNAGCAGLSYTMDYAESAEPFEEVVEDKGVKILIDPKAIMFLLGTTMDYKVDKLKSGFEFINPNETERCGCGESFKVA